MTRVEFSGQRCGRAERLIVGLSVSHIERYELVPLTDGDARAVSHSRQLDGDEGAWQGADGALLDICVSSFDVPHVQHRTLSQGFHSSPQKDRLNNAIPFRTVSALE
jgi:hypothetical protein